MNYLIDGHNLIGKIDDIQLSDPDDEAKLVLRLINWAAVGKNRRVIVVFDGGVPGQQWANMKSERLRAVFVPKGSTADDWIVRFMYKQVKNPREFHVVTSDNAILKQADNRRIVTTKSDQFAKEMAAERRGMSAMADEPKKPNERPLLKEHEVDAWLQFFGGEPDLEIKPYKPKTKPKPDAKPEATPDQRPATSADPDDFLLSQNEISDWLNLFGGEPTILTVHEASARSKVSPGKHSGETRTVRKTRKGPKVEKDSKVSQEDIDLFHTLFGGDE